MITYEIHETIRSRPDRPVFPQPLFFKLAQTLVRTGCLLGEALDDLELLEPDWLHWREGDWIGLAVLARYEGYDLTEWPESFMKELGALPWDLWYHFTHRNAPDELPVHLFLFFAPDPSHAAPLALAIAQAIAQAMEGWLNARVEIEPFLLKADQISRANPTARATSPTG